MQSPETRIGQEVRGKSRGDLLRVPAKKDSEEHQSEQRRNFRGGKDVLDDGARFHAEDINDRERDNYQDGDQVLRVQPNIHTAQSHGSNGELRHFPEMDNPITRRDCRPENPEKFAERHAHGSDCPRLNHEKQGAAVEKTPEGAERLAQIDILPACPGHHGGEFAIGKRADNGEKTGDAPCANQQRRGRNLARDLGGHNKDARADHGTHHQHGRAGQAEAFDELFVLMGVPLPIAAVRSDFRSGNWGSNVRAHEPPNSVAPPSRRLSQRQRVAVATAGQMPALRESRLYLNICKNSSADLPGSSNKSDITAPASAPASTTKRALARVIPPIATSGLRVSSLARRMPSRPMTGSGLALLVVAKMVPLAR